MGLLTLYAGLLLPWLGGTFWLAFAESRLEPNKSHNRIRQAGYGFFLGYAVLFMAIIATDRLTGTTSWAGLMLFLGVFATSGGLAVWLTPGSSPSTLNPVPAPPRSSKSTAVKLLTVLVVAWTAVHLVFIAVDVFNQPLYPWDAWLAWVYRAKAWFLAGGMTAVVGPAEWASAVATNTYTIEAWMYPLFPSVIPYWAALSLGNWSETLVNLPVLFAGIAIGMALYGQCREHGLGVKTSLVCCYLLYSIPIFATHIALAGYADIWMAGFTGLGFIAIIRAAVIKSTVLGADGPQAKYGLQMALGLLMAALGILVKNEGVVWFLAVLALLILINFRARVPILIFATIALAALLGFALGVTHISIPLVGTLGVVDGRLLIPFIGKFALELHNIWGVYWDNFFAMGNWNLLWVLVLASLILSCKSASNSSTHRVPRIGLAFFSIFLATQLFIFGLTDQGIWADTYTAINRLPLHFVPALLFAAFIVLHAQCGGAGCRREQLRSFLLQPLKAAVLATGVVIAGLWLYLSHDLPDTAVDSLDYPAAGFSFAFGSGYPNQDRMVVDGFANGYALLSSGPVSIQADIQQVLRYEWVPASRQEAAFFWRQKGKADNVIRTEITAPGKHLIDLSTEAGWNGEIIEFGFLVAGGQDDAVEIGEATLQPDSLNIRLQLMWQAWTAFEERSQQSINFLQGGDYRQVVSLPLLLIAWLLAGILIIRVLPTPGLSTKRSSVSHRSSILMYGGVLFLVGWMLLDIRWTTNSFRQARVMLQTRSQAPLNSNLDGEIQQYVQRLKADVLGDKPARILIIGDENAIDYYLLRAKYHLLPHSVDVASHFNKELSPQSLNFVIFFGQPGGIAKVRGWSPSWRKALVEVDRADLGVVYRVGS
ncbi:MAG: hypothetical protein BMS9Abin30_0813 [Gammaproteobacteria bacterium]|nr:MAG: hypothetical protein BMS9Abin30_0813 [Gammaproteobacteria bacterium]